MGKGGNRRGRTKDQNHWSLDPMFIDRDGLRLTASQVESALRRGELASDEYLGLIHYPTRRIKASQVADVLARGFGRGRILQCSDWIDPAPPAHVPAGAALQAGGGLAAGKRAAKIEPDRLAWLGSPLLIKLAIWAVVSYCLIGFTFNVFVTQNPEMTFSGVVVAAIASVFRVGIAYLCVLIPLGGMLSKVWSEFWSNFWLGVFALANIWLATIFWGESIDHLGKNQLAPLAVLEAACMEAGIQRGHRIGAECRDGWNSRSTGQGTCSHHGGVAYWRHQERQTRTHQECRAKAERISWR